MILFSAHVDNGLHLGETKEKELGKNDHEILGSKRNLLWVEYDIYVHE